ncbi:hypothetical protein DPMN_169943 [Dreissena polymorpha]|uniref:Uncharacterized protein n=1 Tax=Dreissena polymorpha TaxID=45954 RepID=A0A9D4IB35_DREPO|nr:hypothetical protein DPMN_169943 [Dreissena polymorpha]
MIGQKMTSRRKTAAPPPTPSPAGHVIQPTGTIFKLNSHIKETNFLIKFHENWAKIRLLECSHKNAPPTGGHVCSPIWTIFKLLRHIKNNNFFTNFHDDWAKIVTSRVFTNSHFIQLTGTILKLNSHIKETNVHMFSLYTYTEKFPVHWQPYINKTNVLTNFHDDWAKIVTSRVFTRKTAPPTGGHIGTKLLTKFHEDGTRNQMLTDGRTYDGKRPVTKALLSNQFLTWQGPCLNIQLLTKFEDNMLNIQLLTKFERTLNTDRQTDRPTDNFELGRDFIGAKLLTKFHDDGTRNVASRVLTSKSDKDWSEKLT